MREKQETSGVKHMDQISLNEAARAVGGKNDKDANVSGVFTDSRPFGEI